MGWILIIPYLILEQHLDRDALAQIGSYCFSTTECVAFQDGTCVTLQGSLTGRQSGPAYVLLIIAAPARF